MSRDIEVPTLMGSNKITPPEVSAQIKKDSRVRGAVYEEVIDVECAADGCGRVFIQRMKGQEFCTRHRTHQVTQ